MLKKLFISCLILCAAANTAFAVNHKGKTHYKSRSLYKGESDYKGELPPQPRPVYKEVATTTVTDFTPCVTYNITPGPYIGINPGFRTNYNSTSSVYKGFEGTVFAGYAMLNSSFYLAGEIFAQHSATLQNYKNNLNNNLNPIGVKTTWGAGLSLLPGYELSDTLLGFLRLGGVISHFDEATTATGGQVGIGLEGTVSESWDVRAEYDYTFYQSLSNLGSVRSDQFRLGVLYKFWT